MKLLLCGGFRISKGIYRFWVSFFVIDCQLLRRSIALDFVAIDFETANSDRDSACALGIVLVNNGEIVKQEYHLICPPKLSFNPYNVKIHGITEKDVIDKPRFHELWPDIKHYFEGNSIISHNASFDMSVLRNCLDFYEITYPSLEYGCTYIMSKIHWPDLSCYKLDTVAASIDFDFRHHHALEDALACAQIALQVFNGYQARDLQVLASNMGFSIGCLYPGGYRPASGKVNNGPSLNTSSRKSSEKKYYNSKAELDKALHTLIGIIGGIAIDEVINYHEIKELESWFINNAHLLRRPPFSEIVNMLDEAFSDGIFTAEEKADIIWVCNNYGQDNMYHDSITYDIQILHGIMHGVIADNRINQIELEKLDDWLAENDHLTGIYPYDELCSLLLTVLKDGQLTDDEVDILKVFFSDYVDIAASPNLDEQEIAELKKIITLPGICAACPSIDFGGNLFCFTGQSTRASRNDISNIIVSKGGQYKDTVTQNTAYLIVGGEGSPCWAFSCYGRKVEKAMNMRKAGKPIMIIHENDFWDAIA